MTEDLETVNVYKKELGNIDGKWKTWCFKFRWVIIDWINELKIVEYFIFQQNSKIHIIFNQIFTCRKKFSTELKKLKFVSFFIKIK